MRFSDVVKDVFTTKAYAARTIKEDPLQSFMFRVQLSGMSGELGFTKVAGLSREVAVVEYFENMYEHAHKLPGRESVFKLCKTILTRKKGLCRRYWIDIWKFIYDNVTERSNRNMEIGKKLKKARVQSGLTQENVAEKINVSRQAISNWENEKSYPDIISVIELSNLYSISLDDLLKGDEKMIEHLEESTNVVKSNQKMIWAIIVNIIVVALLITLNMFIPDNRYFLVGVFCLMVITSSALLYQIFRRL